MDISCTSRWKTSSSLLWGSALHFEFKLSQENLIFFHVFTSVRWKDWPIKYVLHCKYIQGNYSGYWANKSQKKYRLMADSWGGGSCQNPGGLVPIAYAQFIIGSKLFEIDGFFAFIMILPSTFEVTQVFWSTHIFSGPKKHASQGLTVEGN